MMVEPAQELHVCANCLKARNNPVNLTSPRCCEQPVLFAYKRDPHKLGITLPSRVHTAARQLSFAETDRPPKPEPAQQWRSAPKRRTLERCRWCDELHEGGPEHCGHGWENPGGSL